ncbi:hypothetical protein FPQ18DRAFT_310070 [Pyronema domesticum]|nr:hypothetical protein FPQ18DRAFT_310070 [Pyronema domesticum]
MQSQDVDEKQSRRRMSYEKDLLWWSEDEDNERELSSFGLETKLHPPLALDFSISPYGRNNIFASSPPSHSPDQEKPEFRFDKGIPLFLQQPPEADPTPALSNSYFWSNEGSSKDTEKKGKGKTFGNVYKPLSSSQPDFNCESMIPTSSITTEPESRESKGSPSKGKEKEDYTPRDLGLCMSMHGKLLIDDTDDPIEEVVRQALEARRRIAEKERVHQTGRIYRTPRVRKVRRRGNDDDDEDMCEGGPRMRRDKVVKKRKRPSPHKQVEKKASNGSIMDWMEEQPLPVIGGSGEVYNF